MKYCSCRKVVLTSSSYSTKDGELHFGTCEHGLPTKQEKPNFKFRLTFIVVAIIFVAALAGINYWGETLYKEREAYFPDPMAVLNPIEFQR